MARLWRVHHPELPESAGATVELSSEESHHVSRVLRLRAGDTLAVFDGRGAEWQASIVAAAGARVALRLESLVGGAVEPPLDVVLFQGLGHPERMDWIAQKATEVGVAGIAFVATGRGLAEVSDRRLARWRRIALEAAKQSGRRRVPRVERSAGLPPPDPAGPLPLLLDVRADARPLGEVVAATAPPAAAWIAVGPEGGFAPGEVEVWAAAGWRRVSLGPRTLRAETAGLVASTILLHLHGDLGSASRADPSR